MRYIALLTLLALAGCGGDDASRPASASGDCAAAVVYHGTTYVKAQDTRPALDGRLTGGYVPACDDHEGDPGTDQPVTPRRIRGTSPDEAVYSLEPFPGVYRRAEP